MHKYRFESLGSLYFTLQQVKKYTCDQIRKMFEMSHADLKEWRACRPRRHYFRVLVHEDLKGQPLSIRFAWPEMISSKFHDLVGKLRVEELGKPQFDVLKTPDAVRLRRQAPAHNVQDEKVE